MPSRIDQVFGPIPGPLIQEWGQPAVFVKAGTPSYDPTTGTVTKSETRTNVKIVITRLDINEANGLYQIDDVKILIDPQQLSGQYITTADYFEVPKGAGTELMKVIQPLTYRGEKPVFFIVIARPQ
jgi:hypothetical protein